MQYIGGKQKSGGQHIAALIKHFARALKTTEIDERFCGGLSVTYRLRGFHVTAADACEPLINLYLAMLSGWDPPTEVSRETWERYRDAPDPADPMTAFCGFGCSRSGAWFSSYVERFKRTGNHYVPAATAARDSLRRKLSHCEQVDFIARDYAAAPVYGVIYCDKPYVGSLGYPAVGPFDHARFWEWAEENSRYTPILVSEREAPDSFVVLKEWDLQNRIATGHGERRVERVFVHKGWQHLAEEQT